MRAEQTPELDLNLLSATRELKEQDLEPVSAGLNKSNQAPSSGRLPPPTFFGS